MLFSEEFADAVDLGTSAVVKGHGEGQGLAAEAAPGTLRMRREAAARSSCPAYRQVSLQPVEIGQSGANTT